MVVELEKFHFYVHPFREILMSFQSQTRELANIDGIFKYNRCLLMTNADRINQGSWDRFKTDFFQF